MVNSPTPLLFLIACLLSACSSGSGFAKDPIRPAVVSPVSKNAPPKTRLVRTTAYCHLEDGIRRNALSTSLVSGKIYSASADWSRYPAGTIFKIAENGRTYVIDDYGPALVGTDTIDLYVPTMREMHRWGVRQVHVTILQPGSATRSLAILRPRSKRAYIRRMVRDLEQKSR